MKQTLSQGEPQRATPDHNWPLEKLTEYVKDCLKCREEMTEQYKSIGRKSSVELFRAGHALHLLRTKLKADKAYVQWLDDNGIARSTAHEAIKLHYRAKTESAVEQLTITEAKIKFGVVKKKTVPKLSVPKKANDDGKEEPHEDGPAELTKADTVLVVMAKKLEEVVIWDRTNLNPVRLDEMARRCIKLLSSFLLKETLPVPKKSSKKRRGNDAA